MPVKPIMPVIWPSVALRFEEHPPAEIEHRHVRQRDEHAPEDVDDAGVADAEEIEPGERVLAGGVAQFLGLLALERAHHADAAERLADPRVHLALPLEVELPHFADRPDPQERGKCHRPEQRKQDQREFRIPVVDDDEGEADAEQRDERRNERHLHQPGQRFEVAGQPRDHSAGLDVVKPRQREAQQMAVEHAAHTREHARVQRVHPVVTPGIERAREQHHPEQGQRITRQQLGFLVEREPGVLQHLVDRLADQPWLVHLEHRHHHREQQDRSDPPPKTPDRPHIEPEILPAIRRRRVRLRLSASLSLGRPRMAQVVPECPVKLARRAPGSRGTR